MFCNYLFQGPYLQPSLEVHLLKARLFQKGLDTDNSNLELSWSMGDFFLEN